jgi:small nuclear ribonucleoprotein (snRNP)-like protein
VNGTAANPPVVQVELSGGEAIDPALAIIDSFGNVTVEDARGIYSGSRRVKTALHPNHRYFIRVKEKSGNAGSPKIPYLLRLTHVNSAQTKSYK